MTLNSVSPELVELVGNRFGSFGSLLLARPLAWGLKGRVYRVRTDRDIPVFHVFSWSIRR